MALIPVSLFFEFVILFVSLYLWEGGFLSRLTSIFTFVSEIGFIAQPQYFMTDNSGPITILSSNLPVQLLLSITTFFAVMTYISIAKTFEEIGRDYLGRRISI